MSDRPDREDQTYGLGKALWSPKRDVGDADSYKNMRRVAPGDIILHLIDNQAFAGLSVAAAYATGSLIGLPGTPWEGRPCYFIPLKDYTALDPALDRSWVLSSDNGSKLEKIRNEHENVFFSSKLELNQGAYLTEAPPALCRLLSETYAAHAGKDLASHHGVFSIAERNEHKWNASRVVGAQRLFRWIYGDEGFSSERYVSEERSYKVALRNSWLASVSEEKIREAIQSDAVAYANNVGELVSTGNLLPWRYATAIKGFTNQDSAIGYLRSLQELLFSDQSSIDRFNDAMSPRYRDVLAPTGIKPASHVIPSLFLWLTNPVDHFLVRPDAYNRAAAVLIGDKPDGQGQIMSDTYYRQAVQFARHLQEKISDLDPRDLIDVQGFIWSVFSRPRIWFGGKTYDVGDMLPQFMERGVYAIGFAREKSISDLLVRGIGATKEQREEIRVELEKGTESGKERNAVLSFFDLASAPSSILIAKSTWHDRAKNASLIGVQAVARTGTEISFDQTLGHQLSVTWLTHPKATLPLAGQFPKLAPTLANLPLDEALSLFGGEIGQAASTAVQEIAEEPPKRAATIQPKYDLGMFEKETGFDRAVLADWERRLRRKQQLVVQGPPGTGKTFVAERLARLLVSETTGLWDVVQFHPTYSYEDFIQGIRPRTVNGTISYELEAGRFVEFCSKAALVGGAPCVLIIDEINRANLSRVFGELMYSLEYRDKEIALAAGGVGFRIPSNVYLIGTMNTADRSIALVDHALRRRFTFIHLGPDYSVLGGYLRASNCPDENLVDVLRDVNALIGEKNYQVGISFFMKDGAALPDCLEVIWKGEIEPYLEEYFFDQESRVEPFRWSNLVEGRLAAWRRA